MLLLSKFTVKYNDTLEDDKRAIQDVRKYLSRKQWKFLKEALGDSIYSLNDIIFSLDMAGVRGYPVDALLRTYRLEQYRAWCKAEGIIVDRYGFRVKHLTLVK